MGGIEVSARPRGVEVDIIKVADGRREVAQTTIAPTPTASAMQNPARFLCVDESQFSCCVAHLRTDSVRSTRVTRGELSLVNYAICSVAMQHAVAITELRVREGS